MGVPWGIACDGGDLQQRVRERTLVRSACQRTKERVPLNILTLNLLFSTPVFWIAAKIYLIPRLHELRPRSVLLPILLLRPSLAKTGSSHLRRVDA